MPYPGILVTRIYSEYTEDEYGSFLQQPCRRQMVKPWYPEKDGNTATWATVRDKGKKSTQSRTHTTNTHTCIDVHLHKPSLDMGENVHAGVGVCSHIWTWRHLKAHMDLDIWTIDVLQNVAS